MLLWTAECFISPVNEPKVFSGKTNALSLSLHASLFNEAFVIVRGDYSAKSHSIQTSLSNEAFWAHAKALIDC
jgi:hypothetical protein